MMAERKDGRSEEKLCLEEAVEKIVFLAGFRGLAGARFARGTNRTSCSRLSGVCDS